MNLQDIVYSTNETDFNLVIYYREIEKEYYLFLMVKGGGSALSFKVVGRCSTTRAR